jgi:hypothetical protein
LIIEQRICRRSSDDSEDEVSSVLLQGTIWIIRDAVPVAAVAASIKSATRPARRNKFARALPEGEKNEAYLD